MSRTYNRQNKQSKLEKLNNQKPGLAFHIFKTRQLRNHILARTSHLIIAYEHSSTGYNIFGPRGKQTPLANNSSINASKILQTFFLGCNCTIHFQRGHANFTLSAFSPKFVTCYHLPQSSSL